MEKKPITPGIHGFTDYAFGFALMTVPALLGADKKTVQLYRLIAAEIFVYAALTKQPYALKPLIPLPLHKKIDFANLAGLGLFTGYSGIRKRKNTLAFHLGLTALGLVNVLLTDWKDR